MTQTIPTIETRIVRKLAQAAIASGFTVTVFDGEEYVLKYSTDIEAIMGAVASTDEDVLLFHHPKGPEGLRERIGSVDLVWGNDSEILSDNTVSEEMTGLMDPVEAWIEAGCPEFPEPFALPVTEFRGVPVPPAIDRPRDINARFWVLGPKGNPVKLTIAPHGHHHHSFGGPTDEGYFQRSYRWTFENDVVTEESYYRGRDCDGVIERFSTVVCLRKELMDGDDMGPIAVNNHMIPCAWGKWKTTEEAQRDHAAEAAGY